MWRNLGFAMILFWINVMFIHGIKKCCYSFCIDINRIVLYGINLVSWIRHFIDLLHKKGNVDDMNNYFYIVGCHRKLFTGVSNINLYCDNKHDIHLDLYKKRVPRTTVRERSTFKHSFDNIFYCSADERSQPRSTCISTILFVLMKSRKMIIVWEIFKIKISFIELKCGSNWILWC